MQKLSACISSTIRIMLVMVLGLFPGISHADDTAFEKTNEKVTIGIFPRRNMPLTVQLFTPLAEYMERTLKMEVELVTAPTFSEFWSKVRAGEFDLVHYNQYHYVKSSDMYEVIAQNEEFNSSYVAGAIYVPADSQIEKISDLKRTKISFGGGKNAMMSYITPKLLLIEGGLTEKDYETVIVKSPPHSILSLYHGQTDAAGAGDILLSLPVMKKSIDTSKLKILARTPNIAHLPWAVKKTLKTALKNRIEIALLSINEGDEGANVLSKAEMTGIKKASDNDYKIHRDMIRVVEQSESQYLSSSM